MLIKVNKDRILDVKEEHLIVKDKMLYNTKTKEYEGVDGDIASFEFEEDGRTVCFSGSVESYTCDDKVCIRGCNEPYLAPKKKITHISVVDDESGISDEEKGLRLINE